MVLVSLNIKECKWSQCFSLRWVWVSKTKTSWMHTGKICAWTLRGILLQGHLEVITLIWDRVTPAACFFFTRPNEIRGPGAIIWPHCCDRQHVCFLRSMEAFLWGGSYLSMTGTGVRPCDKGISFPPQGSEEVWRWRLSTLASHVQVPVRNKTKRSSFAVCFLPSASEVCNR